MTRVIGGHVTDGHDVAGTYQPSFDWKVSRDAGDELAGFKASQGTTFRDAWFVHNRLTTANLGFRYRGIYHWQMPGSVQDQLDFFVKIVGKLLPGEFIQLDQEQKGLTLDDCVLACQLWSTVYPGRVAHYGGLYFGWPQGHSHPRLRPWPWWIAYYAARLPTLPVQPAIWQWGGFPPHQVEGEKAVDANQILNRAAVEALAGYPPPPPEIGSDDVYAFVRRKDRNAVYLANRMIKVWMKTPADYKAMHDTLVGDGIPAVQLAERLLDTQAQLDAWGKTFGDDPGDV